MAKPLVPCHRFSLKNKNETEQKQQTEKLHLLPGHSNHSEVIALLQMCGCSLALVFSTQYTILPPSPSTTHI